MSEPIGTQYGGFWIRFLALLADSAIVFAVSGALLAGAVIALGPEGVAPVALAVWVLGFLYWPVMHASARQATFGKSLLGLKVARVNGGRIGILRSLWREIAKIVSAMVLMIGYVIAAFTPRKQALHDLMASTYVMREGASHVIPALAVAVAGFALPVVGIPMLIGTAAMSAMTNMAEAMIVPQDPMKQAARPAAPAAPKIAAKAPPKPPAPAPVQVAKAPEPEQKAAPAPKPEPIVAAPPALKPEPAVAAPPAPAKVEPQAQPKPARKAAPVRVARASPAPKAAAPAPAAPSASAEAKAPAEPKTPVGPKYNDLMTAVLYRDPEGVTELLTLGKWPDKPDRHGATPLMTAVELGDMRIAETLLRGGANPHLAIPVAEQRGNGEMILLLKRYSGR